MKTCSFCGAESEALVHGKDENITICKECSDKVNKVLSKKSLKTKDIAQSELSKLTPKQIKSMLDEYVIGQDDAKVKLSVSIYNQHKAILASEMGIEVEIDKSNVLLVGPTGSGNVYM